MTYDPLKLGDREILDVMVATRRLGMTTMVHAENHDMIALYVLLLEIIAANTILNEPDEQYHRESHRTRPDRPLLPCGVTAIYR